MPRADGPRNDKREIRQGLYWVNYAKQVASQYGMDYNDLVDYAKYMEDEKKVQAAAERQFRENMKAGLGKGSLRR